ncbi:hypothetical protein ACMFMG_011777 [Clarireedia jacksonii]
MTSEEVLVFTIYYSELDALDCPNDDSFFPSHHICQNTSLASLSCCHIITNLTTTPLGDASWLAAVAMPWLCFHHIAIWPMAKMPRDDVGSCCLLALQINYVSRTGSSATSLYGDGDIRCVSRPSLICGEKGRFPPL